MVSIDKIELKIGGKIVTLSLEQLKELKDVLDKMFPQIIYVDRPYPLYWPVQPVVVQPWTKPYWDTPHWTSNITGNTAQLQCNG